MDWTQILTIGIAVVSLVISFFALWHRVRISKIDKTKALEDQLIQRKLDIYQHIFTLIVDYLNSAEDAYYDLDKFSCYFKQEKKNKKSGVSKIN